MAAWTRDSVFSELQGISEPELVERRLDAMIRETDSRVVRARLHFWGAELLLKMGHRGVILHLMRAQRLDERLTPEVSALSDEYHKRRGERDTDRERGPREPMRLTSAIPHGYVEPRVGEPRITAAHLVSDAGGRTERVQHSERRLPSVRPVSEWGGYSVGVVPSEAVILVTAPLRTSIASTVNFVGDVIEYFVERAEEDERPEPNDILLEASLVGEGWHSSFTVTARQASPHAFRFFARSFRTAALPIISVALELPQLHLFMPIDEILETDTEPLVFSMVLARAAYHRTPHAISRLLAEHDTSGFARWFEEALGEINV
jgi:hypothetical protein